MITPTLAQQKAAWRILLHYRNDPSRWTEGAWARDKDGIPTGAATKSAVCWCLEGACVATGTSSFQLLKITQQADHLPLAAWNDTHSFQELHDLLSLVAYGQPFEWPAKPAKPAKPPVQQEQIFWLHAIVDGKHVASPLVATALSKEIEAIRDWYAHPKGFLAAVAGQVTSWWISASKEDATLLGKEVARS